MLADASPWLVADEMTEPVLRLVWRVLTVLVSIQPIDRMRHHDKLASKGTRRVPGLISGEAFTTVLKSFRAKPNGPQINDGLLRLWLAILVSLSAMFVGNARAETVNISCDSAGETAPAKLLLTYEGGASGTLTVQAPFGTLSLPATKENRQDVEDGEKLTATGIRAFGSATVTMPDKAAIEACVAKNLARTKRKTRTSLPPRLALALNRRPQASSRWPSRPPSRSASSTRLRRMSKLHAHSSSRACSRAARSRSRPRQRAAASASSLPW